MPATTPDGMITNAMSAIFDRPTPAPTPGVTPPVASPAPTPAPAPPAPPSLMGKFVDLWKTKPVDPNAPKPPVSFLENVTPENVTKAASTVAFSQAATPELMALVEKGGKEGQQAMLQIMESMSRDSYGKGALATKALLQEALKEERANWEKELPKRIRDHEVRGSASAKNPVLATPALKPLTQALEVQFAAQNPTASAEEVSSMVAEYFYELTQVLTPLDPNANRKAQSGDMDWDKFGTE